jgi:hypothetical protein
LTLPSRQKHLADIIDSTEHGFNIDHGGSGGSGWSPET